KQHRTITLTRERTVLTQKIFRKVYCYACAVFMAYPGVLSSLYAAAVWIASYALVAHSKEERGKGREMVKEVILDIIDSCVGGVEQWAKWFAAQIDDCIQHGKENKNTVKAKDYGV
ncbi:LOW QUALITY PROTEIN: hypothetical protein M8C21_022500, partial [Ambrosia artemisiifolia]